MSSVNTSNPITLTYEPVNSNTIRLNWKHRLIYSNKSPLLSEKLKSVVITLYSYVDGITVPDVRYENITSRYYEREYILSNIPKTSTNPNLGNKDYNFHRVQIEVFTTYGTSKNSITFYVGISGPSAPRNLVAQRNANNSVTVGWLSPTGIGSSSSGNSRYIINYQLEYSKNGGETWFSTLIPGNSTSYTYTSLERNNQYLFRVSAISAYTNNGNQVRGEQSQVFGPVFVPPTTAADATLLFEKSSWGNIASPWKEYLTFAAEEWESHVRIDPKVVEAIRQNDPNFMGIKINVSFISQPSVGGSVVSAYIPVNTIKGFNLNPTDPESIKWNTSEFDLVINTHPDVNTIFEADNILVDDVWRAILTHELGHGLGIGIVWQPDWIVALNKQRRIVLENNNQIIRSQLIPHAPRWQLSGTFVAPWDRDRGVKPRFPAAQLAYNNLMGYTNQQIANLRPRGVIPLMSNIVFSDFEKRGHWAYETNTNNAFTSTHLPIPNDIMSYGGLVGVVQQQITPVSAGVLRDLGYLATTSAPSTTTFASQIASNTNTGYSSRMTAIPESTIPKTYPGENTISSNQIIGTIDMDSSGKIKELVFNLDSQ